MREEFTVVELVVGLAEFNGDSPSKWKFSVCFSMGTGITGIIFDTRIPALMAILNIACICPPPQTTAKLYSLLLGTCINIFLAFVYCVQKIEKNKPCAVKLKKTFLYG